MHTGKWSGKLLITAGIAALALLAVAVPGEADAATLDIKTFGAKCDGTNDAAAVQSAVNALANGDTLVVPCVASIGSAGVLIADKTNIRVDTGTTTGGFRAIGIPSWGSSGGFGPSLFKLQNCDNCHVYGLTINANNLQVAGILLDASDNSTIENVVVSNVACPGTSCTAAAGIVGDHNTNSRFIGNTVHTTGGSQTGNGIRGFWIRDAGTLITGNTVREAGGTAIACNCSNAEISHNKSHNNAVSGIKLSGAGFPANGNTGTSSIHHNIIYGNSQGITLEMVGGSETAIYENEAYGHIGDIIYANGSPFKNLRITNNYFHDNAGTAVKFLSALNGALVEGNRLHNNGLAIHVGEVGGAFTGVTINRNDIQGGGMVYQNSGSVSVNAAVTYNSFRNIPGWAWTIAQGIGGTITQSNNCFAGNGGNVSDGRGIIANPASSASCPDPTGSTTTPDITPPVIAGLASSVTPTSATITWTTDEFSDSSVDYGTTTAFGSTASNPSFVLQHSVQLNGLAASTTYYYRVSSKDFQGNVATTTDFSFATPAQPVYTFPQGPWTGKYYQSKGNNKFSKLLLTRTDSLVNFDWKAGSPDPKVPADNFGVQWSGRINFPVAGTYSFTAVANDGIRVYIDNVKVFERWSNTATTATSTFSRNIAAGDHSIVVEYYEATGPAAAKLSWTLGSQSLASKVAGAFTTAFGALRSLIPTPASAYAMLAKSALTASAWSGFFGR